MNQIILTFIVLCIVVLGCSLLSAIHTLLGFAAFLTFCIYMEQIISIVGNWVLRVRSQVLSYFA